MAEPLKTRRVEPEWAGEPCIVAAPGPSLTPEVIRRVRFARWMNRWRVICVQDAYQVMPWADLLYGANSAWWQHHKGCIDFKGERWSSHEEEGKHTGILNDKREVFEAYGMNLARGQAQPGFSFDPEVIHYGSNSGFQGINMALLKGCTRIVLVGFDLRYVDGKSHFFGDHPVRINGWHTGLHQNRDEDYRRYAKHFQQAAELLPARISIVNATPNSALTCFPMASFEDACRTEPFRPNGRVHRDRAEPHAATG